MFRMHLVRLVVGALLVTLSTTLGAQEDPGSIYLLSREEARVLVFPADLRAASTLSAEDGVAVELPISNPTRVFPTPGGKYVFVVGGESGEIVTIDSEDHTVHQVFALDGVVPLSIDFSPQGHTAVVRTANHVMAYDHAAGRLTNPRRTSAAALSSSAPQLATNRRGTRAYVGLDEELVYLSTEDLRQFERVDTGVEAPIWSMAPDYRFLWGVSEDMVVVVDERRGRVIARRRGSYLPAPPVFVRTAGSAFLASGSSPELLQFDDRRHRVREQITLPASPIALAGDDSRGVWVLTSGGEVVRYDTVTNALTSVATVGPGYDSLAYVGFKPNGGFACF